MNDWLGFLLCVLYVGLMLGLAELLRYRWQLSPALRANLSTSAWA
jgi:hypothetical protein